MRQKREKQRPLSPPWPDHQLANELKVISRILDDNPQTLELIVQDLSDRVDSSVGAPGLTAEQVLRCAVIKQLHQFSYRKLEFHLVDSQSCQRFCRLPYGASLGKATLAENLGKIEPGTWKAINDHLVRWAQARGLEKGQRIRVDATAVQTNVHYPLDSELLYDGIRVVTRWLGRLRDWEGIGFVDHTRRAKRRVLNIRNRRAELHWELAAPDGMVLEPSTTYALVFLGDGGTYPKMWTKDADTEDGPDEGWSLADALLYRSGTSWVEDPAGRSLRIEIVGPRRVDLDPVASIRNRSIREDIGTAVLTVTLSWPSRVSVSVPWSTSELDAVSPDDYTDGRGVLTFAPGATEATISIPIADDAVPEEVESFAVTLGPGEGYRSNPSSNVAFAKILDNDGDELVPSRATVNGTTLVLTYNEILDSASTPYPFHFYVTADDNRVEVDQVSVGGSMVTLTLATAVEAGQTVTLDYVSGVGQNQIQDGEGNAAMSFTDWLVTNITGGGTEPPVDGGDGGGGGTPPPGGGGGSGGGGGGGGGGGAPSATVPGAPANLQADGGDEQVTLFWETPENDGGLAITDYEYRINGRGGWVSIDSTLTTYTVTGLVNGTAYVFQVRAVNAAGRSLPSNRAEATPRATAALDFAHFANGASWQSGLVFVNGASHPIRPAVYFYDQEGDPIAAESVVDLTGDLMVTEDGALSIQTEMEPLGELTVSTHGRGELVSGSVQVVSEGPLGGVLRYALPGIGVTGVGASQAVWDALFPVRQEGNLETAAAIRNVAGSDLVVTCRLMKDGAVLEETEVPLAANGQESLYLEELFAFTRADVSDFVGSVRCTVPPGEGMFTGVAVEIDEINRILTTLPVVPVTERMDRE